MHGRFGIRVRALLLALLLALGSSLAFVQGSLSAAEMAVSAEAGHAGPGGCDDCGGHDCEADAAACLSLCASAAQGMPPGEQIASPPISRPVFEVVGLAAGGRSNSPEHGPPKLIAIG